MADSDDEIARKAKLYGWGPDQIAHIKSLRKDIPSGSDTSVAQNTNPYQNYAEKVNDPNRSNMNKGGKVENPRIAALKRLKSKKY